MVSLIAGAKANNRVKHRVKHEVLLIFNNVQYQTSAPIYVLGAGPFNLKLIYDTKSTVKKLLKFFMYALVGAKLMFWWHKHKPDVFVIHTEGIRKAVFFAMLWRKLLLNKTHIPRFVHVLHLPAPIESWFLKYVPVEVFTTPSYGAKMYYDKNFPQLKERLFVVPNPIDLKQIQKLAKQPQNKIKKTKKTRRRERERHSLDQHTKQTINIITIGRLNKQKALTHFMRVLSALQRRHKNLRIRGYILGGRGDLTENLHALAAQINNKHSKKHGNKHTLITFIDFDPNPFKYVAAADIYFSTSQLESFNMALLEAMAVGKPVIATDVIAGPRELLGYDTTYENLLTHEFKALPAGILTPNMGEDIFDASAPLTDAEKINLEALEYMLQHPKYAQQAAKNAQKLAQTYDVASVREQFDRVVVGEGGERIN